MATKSTDRINDLSMTTMEVVLALSEGNTGAATVVMRWLSSSPFGLIEILTLDTKRLYGDRIWELFTTVCGEDLERFKYHVAVELPNQETGELSVTGPHSPDFDDYDFWAKRRFGKPGSFWALENPPAGNYEYPIR